MENATLILDTVSKILLEYNLGSLQRKKTSTHGGEWCGPCPRCKRLGIGGANVDRLLVHPERPAWGRGSRDEPCFRCRQCRMGDDSSKMWCGDLVAFVMEMRGWDYGTALRSLGLSGPVSNATSVLLTPRLSVTGAPNEIWQLAAITLVNAAYETLWGEQGVYARQYLTDERGLMEETIRWAVLGCIEETTYQDGRMWGVEGKVKIPRGIVFPEYHATLVDGQLHRELWSLAIRRPDMDILEEEIETGKRSEKYHLVKGSVKGLYLGDTITPEKPLCLQEGQIDALTAWQESKGAWASAATQSVSGARNIKWIERIATAPYTLLTFDPDAAGQEATQYWRQILDADRILTWPVVGSDMNKFYTQGGDVAAFLERGKQVYCSLYDFALRGPTEASDIQRATILPPSPENPQISVSDDFRGIEYDMYCEGCNGAFDGMVMRYTDDGTLLCPQCYEKRLRTPSVVVDEQRATILPPSSENPQISVSDDFCYKCQAPVKYEALDYAFCGADFAASQLLDYGLRMRWTGFTFLAGQGLVIDPDRRWVAAEGATIQGGYKNYLAAIHALSRAQLWLAVQHLHCLSEGVPTPYDIFMKAEKEKVPGAYLCARKGCGRDYRKKVQVRKQQVLREGQLYPDRNAPYVYLPEKAKVNLWEPPLYWCPYCTDGYFALEMGDVLDFPTYDYGTVHIQAGRDAWIAYVREASDYGITVAFDVLRRSFPDAWEEVTLLTIG